MLSPVVLLYATWRGACMAPPAAVCLLTRPPSKDVDFGNIAAGITALTDHGWHPSYIMIYDQPWMLAHQLSEVLLWPWGCSGCGGCTQIAWGAVYKVEGYQKVPRDSGPRVVPPHFAPRLDIVL